MGQTIACANQKGGVGKTTSVVSLASYLAIAGDRVLVIDLDPQGNATSGFGLDRSLLDRSVYDAVIDDLALERLVVEGPLGVDLIPSSIALAGAEVELAPIESRERRLARLIADIEPRYDHIFIDCPPSLGLLTVNALTAADSVLIPLQCEYYALEGLTQLLATIDLVRDHLNPPLAIDGVLLTMYDGRTNLSAEVAAEVRRHLGPLVYQTVIPRSVRLSEAPSHGQPIATYRPDSPGAVAYRQAADEFRARAAGRSRRPSRARPGVTRAGGGRMTVRPERPQSLGRGLASLIPQRHAGQPAPTEIPTDRIRANPYQPRHHMDEAALATLTASIAEHGVVQPILVTEVLDGYQLVAGERRLRAAVAAGLDRIPAVVRQLADNEQLELALVENLQREDLDPIEAALAYRQLIDEFGYSHEAVATRVGRARTTVANTLRLLDLDAAVQAALAGGEISEGHARALGGLAPEAQGRVLGTVIEQALSVRQTEELVRRLREPKPEAAPRPQRLADPDLDRVEEDLRRALGTKVSLARSRKGGRIVIEFYSDEELGRLYERLTGGTA